MHQRPGALEILRRDGLGRPVGERAQRAGRIVGWLLRERGSAHDEKIVGVILTKREWVGDLWVLREYRRQGIGSRLLAQGEAEIAARGQQTCRLRVVRSNAVAVQFYLRQGWQIAREFAHEKYDHAMLEMTKFLPQSL